LARLIGLFDERVIWRGLGDGEDHEHQEVSTDPRLPTLVVVRRRSRHDGKPGRLRHAQCAPVGASGPAPMGVPPPRW
jgi:hypothetical protein